MHFGDNRDFFLFFFYPWFISTSTPPQFYHHVTLLLACASSFPILPPPSQVGLPQPNEFLRLKRWKWNTGREKMQHRGLVKNTVRTYMGDVDIKTKAWERKKSAGERGKEYSKSGFRDDLGGSWKIQGVSVSEGSEDLRREEKKNVRAIVECFELGLL